MNGEKMNRKANVWSAREIRKILAEIKAVPIKKLGQNFLIDRNIAEKIANLVTSFNPKKVLEVGAGLGSISFILHGRVDHITAVEIDRKLAEFLKEQGLNVLNADFLKVYPEMNGYDIFVSNLPYSSAGKILETVIEKMGIKTAVVMVQKEFAERLTAKPNNKNYSYLSVVMQSICEIERVFGVSKNCFYPRPEVESEVVVLRKVREVEEEFKSFVKKAFSTRRKKLSVSISREFGIPKEETEDALKRIGIEGNARAENLSIEDFKNLFNLLIKK